jgi:predicted RNA-binding protein Jag
VEWVEVKGRTVEVAVEAAMAELGIKEKDELIVEVIQEPERGFLGLGGRDAIVRVRPKPKPRQRRREQGSGSDRRGGASRATEASLPGREHRAGTVRGENRRVSAPGVSDPVNDRIGQSGVSRGPLSRWTPMFRRLRSKSSWSDC